MQRVLTCGFLFLVCVRGAANFSEEENWPWTRPAGEPRLQQVAAGRRAELRCAGRLTRAPAHWDFKPCGASGDNATSCADAIAAEREGGGGGGGEAAAGAWSALAEARSTLVLPAAEARHSGLYRCREPATHRINVYSTLELQVLEYGTELDAQLPQFLDGLPENATVSAEEQVILQCKVRSRTPPSIVWVAEGRGPLRYRERTFAPLNSSGELALPGGVYLSKLALPPPHPPAARYACVAVNTRGFGERGARVTLAPPSPDAAAAAPAQPHSLYWLFLMPLALALIPLTLWAVYQCSRQRARKGSEGGGGGGGGGALGRDALQIELVHLNRPRTIPEDEIV